MKRTRQNPWWGILDSKWRRWSGVISSRDVWMEAKIKTQKNPWTENSPPKISCPNFRNWEFTRAKGDSYDDKAGRTMNKMDEKGRFMKWSLVRKASGRWWVCRTSGGGTQPHERLRPKGGTFCKSQVYERVGVSLVEVYKRVGKSVFPSVKRPKIAKGLQ